MSSLKKTSFVGTVTWIGVVKDSTVDLRSESTPSLTLTFAGHDNECHAGLTRKSCSRVLNQYPLGTIIRNVRQLSVLSAEEIAQIATNLGVSTISPASLGASLVIQGIPDLSHLPPNCRLRMQDGSTLTIDMENRPCSGPGHTILKDCPEIGHWSKFKPAAEGIRGVKAWVEREGTVKVGDTVELFVPDQRPWKHAGDLRGFDMNIRDKDSKFWSNTRIDFAWVVYIIVAGVVLGILINFYTKDII